MASNLWIDECFLTSFVVSLTTAVISIISHRPGYTLDVALRMAGWLYCALERISIAMARM